MRKFFFVIFLFFFPAVSYSQPSIQFDTYMHDFGTVQQGDILEYTFDFMNGGDKELIIEKLVPS